jgi:hypothetical protein
LVVRILAVAWSGSSSFGQPVPWLVFEDDLSASVCDAVNAENGELIVLADTQELVLVTGGDIILDGTFVDISGFGPPWFVFSFNDPAGIIDFAADGDGLRTLWWLALNGSVVSLDDFTGEPVISGLFPSDFVEVPCDASPFWDGCLDDFDCEDGNECTDNLCVGGFCETALLDGGVCSDGDSCTRLDTCVVGLCEGLPIFDCGGDGGEGGAPIVINLCGSNMAVTLTMTLMGLGLTGLARRRRVTGGPAASSGLTETARRD